MKWKSPHKGVNPKLMVTHFSKIFKSNVLKKTTARTLLLILMAVAVARTFRINEIARRLAIDVKTEKAKQKRVLRFLDTPFPLLAAKQAWATFVLKRFWTSNTPGHRLLLIDETKLFGDWKAIVAAVPFRNRAIPVFWHVYRDQDIRDLRYKSHNKLVQDFCQGVYNRALTLAPQKPMLIFDRGFARAKYIIKFLKEKEIPFVMRICRNVGITHNQTHKKLHQLPQGSYPSIGYHSTYQIPLALYVLRNAETYKEPMYLISNVLTGPQIYNVYKRRMQIEHAFRDIKSTFGFAKLVLKKDQRARIALLWFIAVLTYGLLFLAYEKTIATWEKHANQPRKVYAIITLIKRIISEFWNQNVLLSFLGSQGCRGRPANP